MAGVGGIGRIGRVGSPGTVVGGPPVGYTWTTNNGEQVFYNGQPVFDDGADFYVRVV